MSEDELAAMDMPCRADCHFWLWTTHKFLPMALRLLEVMGTQIRLHVRMAQAGRFSANWFAAVQLRICHIRKKRHTEVRRH